MAATISIGSAELDRGDHQSFRDKGKRKLLSAQRQRNDKSVERSEASGREERQAFRVLRRALCLPLSVHSCIDRSALRQALCPLLSVPS